MMAFAARDNVLTKEILHAKDSEAQMELDTDGNSPPCSGTLEINSRNRSEAVASRFFEVAVDIQEHVRSFLQSSQALWQPFRRLGQDIFGLLLREINQMMLSPNSTARRPIAYHQDHLSYPPRIESCANVGSRQYCRIQLGRSAGGCWLYSRRLSTSRTRPHSSGHIGAFGSLHQEQSFQTFRSSRKDETSSHSS